MYKQYPNERGGHKTYFPLLIFSTETKLSAHLIYHLPNAVFKDNSHAGKFNIVVAVADVMMHNYINDYNGVDEMFKAGFQRDFYRAKRFFLLS